MKPIVVVRNNPTDDYLEKYGQGLGQRTMMLEYLEYYRQFKELEKEKPEVVSQVKAQRKLEKTKRREYNHTISMLLDKIVSIEKHIDYCMLLTASLPDIVVADNTVSVKSLRGVPGPYVVRAMASQKFMQSAVENKQDYIFLENGYFGNYKNLTNLKSKKIWHRICVNEMQQEAILQVPDDRWNRLVQFDSKLKWTGWKKSGSKILVVMPSQKPCQYYNQDPAEWKAQTIATIKQHTDREIVIREKGSRTERTQKQTIYEALDDDIFCMVTYQSIAAVEAVAYGIPVFTLAPSAAKQVSLQDLSLIETPYYPDEGLVRQWCNSLAYGQFTLEEMLYGDAWCMVMENRNRETISC